MANNVDIEGFADAVMEELEKFKDVSVKEMEKSAQKVARKGVKMLKETSPVGTRKGKKGHYKDGWKVKSDKTYAMKIGITIHNSKKPGLTHLLENGHALRQGGRAEAITHIAPVEKFCVEEYEKEVKERLEKGH